MCFVRNIRLVALHLQGIEQSVWKLIDNARSESYIQVTGDDCGIIRNDASKATNYKQEIIKVRE